MVGLPEIIIILALLVALILFKVMKSGADAAKKKNSTVAQTINWEAIADAELQSYLPHHKIKAIRRYREITNVGLKEAKQAIDYVLANPDAKRDAKSVGVVDTDGAGIRDLIASGKLDEAVQVYAAFMGVDKFTAEKAIEEMQREDDATINLSSEIHDLLAENRKIQAIKRYRETMGVSLKEAKNAVEEMERR